MKIRTNSKIISNLYVYDLQESIIASGYAMRTDTPENFDYPDPSDFKRAFKLGSTPKGSGHDQMLTGIRVAFDLKFSVKAWVEIERYRFVEFVTSQSTMHRIANFDLSKQYNEYVHPKAIELMEELKEKYNTTKDKEDYLTLLYTNPNGFELTARLTTNYRALKTVIPQRETHRLPEWREFCEVMLECLPQFKELTGLE